MSDPANPAGARTTLQQLSAPREFAALAHELEPYARELIAAYPDGQARSALLPILHAFQAAEGWVSPDAIEQTAAWIGEPVSVVESTASFYTLFHRRPIGRYLLQPCRNLSCIVNGAGEIMAHFRKRLGIAHLETSADGLFSYEEAECLAACDRAPCMQVNLEYVYDLTIEKIDAMLQAMRDGTYGVSPLPQNAAPARTWQVPPGGRKAAGARDVPNADDPGGLGDRTGVAVIERLIREPAPVEVRPTRERLIADGPARIADGVATPISHESAG